MTVTSTDTLSSPVSFLTVSVMVAVSDTSADGIVNDTDVGVCSRMWCSSVISCRDSTDQVGVGVGTPSMSTVIWMVSPGTVLIGVGVETILAGTAMEKVFLTIHPAAFTLFVVVCFGLIKKNAFLTNFWYIYETQWNNLWQQDEQLLKWHAPQTGK